MVVVTMAEQGGEPDQCQTGKCQRADNVMSVMVVIPGKFAAELLAHGMSAGMPFGPHLMAPTPPGFALFLSRAAEIRAVIAAGCSVRRVFARAFAPGLFVEWKFFADTNVELSHGVLLYDLLRTISS
jgi:hypothetical protein